MATNLPAWPGTISIAAGGTAITGTGAALTTGAQGALVIVNGLVGQLAADPTDDNTATLLEPISTDAITDASYVLVPISGSVAQALRVRQTLETLAAQPTTASQIAAATETALNDADEIGALQAASGNLIKRTWANLRAQLTSFFLPATAGTTDNAVLRADGTAGNKVQGSAVTIDDAANVAGIARLNGGSLGGLRNKIINGDFNVNQRNAGAVTSGYFIDRWSLNMYSGAITAEVSLFGPGEDIGLPVTGCGYARFNISTAGDVGFKQPIEGAGTLSGQKVTVTFWAFTASAGAAIQTVYFDQNFGTGGSPDPDVIINSGGPYPIPQNAWTKIVAVANLPSVSGKTFGTAGNDALVVRIDFDESFTGMILVAHVSLVAGDATVEFDPAPTRPIGIETLLAQRYFAQTTANARFSAAAGAEYFNNTIYFPVAMRAAPSCSVGAGAVSNCTDSAPEIFRGSARYEIISSAAGDAYAIDRVLTLDAEL